MRESRFQLADGDRNVGRLYSPDEWHHSLPVLVVCHGWPGDQRLYPFTEELCVRATGAGLAIVTFDFYSSGETGGDPAGMSDRRWASNLADVCAYVRDQEWADARRIGALGISSGSTAVLRCAIETQGLAVAISVATCLGHYINMPNGPAKRLIDNLDALLKGGTVELYGYPCGLEYFKDFVGGAPIYRLHEAKCPIFFLQGGADNAFRRTDARLGYEILRGRGLPADYREIGGGDHGLANAAPEATAAVLEWLRHVAFLPHTDGDTV